MALLSLVDVTCRFGDEVVVDGVSFDIVEGTSIGLVGESGSGKTTLGRAALGLVPLGRGEIRYDGRPIAEADAAMRRECRMVFQNAEAMLNPGLRVGELIEEPLVLHGARSKAERRARVIDILTRVGGDPAWLRRRPRQLSGGERRRVALARALAHPPRLLVADEPVAGLDVVRQCDILDILEPEVGSRNGAALIISHDLAVVERLCTEIHVMRQGRIVDTMRRTAGRWSTPTDPYAVELVRASTDLRRDFAEGRP